MKTNENYEKEIFSLIEKGVTNKSLIAKEIGCARSTVKKYFDLYSEKNTNIIEVGQMNKELSFTIQEIQEKYNEKSEDFFNEFEDIFNSLLKIDTFIKNIPDYFNKVGEYDVEQCKTLHELEDCKNNDLYEQLNYKLLCIRKERRIKKNQYFLAVKLRNILQSYKIHSDVFSTIVHNLQEQIDVCKNSVYTPPEPKKFVPKIHHEERMEEWQQKIKDITQKES